MDNKQNKPLTAETLTAETLTKTIEKIIKNRKPSTDRKMIFANYCLSVDNLVMRSSDSLNLCNNPNCENCRELDRLIKEEIESWDSETPD